MEGALRFFELALLLVLALACLVSLFERRASRTSGQQAGSWILSVLLIAGAIAFLGLFVHLTIGR